MDKVKEDLAELVTGVKKYYQADVGLKVEASMMFARTNNNICGQIVSTNFDCLMNGPEIYFNGKYMVIERNSIVDIKSHFVDLLKVGDKINGERIVSIDGEYLETNVGVHNKHYLDTHIKSFEILED